MRERERERDQLDSKISLILMLEKFFNLILSNQVFIKENDQSSKTLNVESLEKIRENNTGAYAIIAVEHGY